MPTLCIGNWLRNAGCPVGSQPALKGLHSKESLCVDYLRLPQ